MLERMHVAKNRKEAAKIQKEEAQAESKERIKRINQRQTIIAAIIPQEHDMETQHPYILVHIETLDKFNTALVDSSLCYNVISVELFHTLTMLNSYQITFQNRE